MDIIKLTEDNAALLANNEQLAADLATANAAKEATAAELVTAQEAVSNLTAEKVAAETALAEAATKAATEKADLLAQIETLKASQADFDKALGAKVLEITGKGGNKAVEGQHEGSGKKEVSRAEFNAMSAKDQSKFALEGGKITE